jgi:hypothetical protein
MSDSEELNRLRADLKALDEIRARYDKDADFTTLVNNMRYRIEAEADPWREAKQFASAYRDPKGSSHLQKLIAHYDHLAAELTAKDKRIAELEAALRRIATVPDCGCVPCRGQCDSAENLRVNAEEIREIARSAVEGVKPITDMQPPFEGPIVGLEPVLDHARVLATAAEWFRANANLKHPEIIVVFGNLRAMSADAKPYQLKKGGE